MFAALLPKSAPFFEMLMTQNALLREAAEESIRLFSETDNRYLSYKRIAELENEADVLYRRIARSLSATFITPIDREDILRISQGQEECLDHFQSLAARLTSYDMPNMLFPAQRTVMIIYKMVGLGTDMLRGLTKRRDAHKTRAFRNMREECDSLLAVGLAEVMDESEKNVASLPSVLKWMQIYGDLEHLLRQVTELSECIEEAVMKNV